MAPTSDAAAAVYWASRRLWTRLEAIAGCLRAVFDGVWLGLLSRPALHRVDERYYELHPEYRSSAHNLGGLFGWEERAVERHFRTARRVLVLGAGGGREVLALVRRGIDVAGYECNPELRDAGTSLLVDLGGGEILPMERDLCPRLEGRFDGVVLGWSTYMLIQGRCRRVSLLRELRGHVSDDGPLLLSFFTRSEGGAAERVSFRVAAMLRRLLSREPPEPGDALAPNFVHCFTRDEVSCELEEAGWRMDQFEPEPYPHAVAKAVPTG